MHDDYKYKHQLLTLQGAAMLCRRDVGSRRRVGVADEASSHGPAIEQGKLVLNNIIIWNCSSPRLQKKVGSTHSCPIRNCWYKLFKVKHYSARYTHHVLKSNYPELSLMMNSTDLRSMSTITRKYYETWRKIFSTVSLDIMQQIVYCSLLETWMLNPWNIILWMGSGPVGSDFLSAIAGRVNVSPGRVQEKWPVDNSDLELRQMLTWNIADWISKHCPNILLIGISRHTGNTDCSSTRRAIWITQGLSPSSDLPQAYCQVLERGLPAPNFWSVACPPHAPGIIFDRSSYCEVIIDSRNRTRFF